MCKSFALFLLFLCFVWMYMYVHQYEEPCHYMRNPAIMWGTLPLHEEPCHVHSITLFRGIVNCQTTIVRQQLSEAQSGSMHCLINTKSTILEAEILLWECCSGSTIAEKIYCIPIAILLLQSIITCHVTISHHTIFNQCDCLLYPSTDEGQYCGNFGLLVNYG